MTQWSKLPPRKPCFVLFRGVRHIRNSLYEHISEPVEVREVYNARVRGLAVAMTGRATLFKLENFAGEWRVLDADELGDAA